MGTKSKNKEGNAQVLNKFNSKFFIIYEMKFGIT